MIRFLIITSRRTYAPPRPLSAAMRIVRRLQRAGIAARLHPV